MVCPDKHCCRGACYQQCHTVNCQGSQGYASDCRIPIGQVDCLEVVNHMAVSCSHSNSVQIFDGILYVTNKCRASIKICTGPGYDEAVFPAVPDKLFPANPLEKAIPLDQILNTNLKSQNKINLTVLSRRQNFEPDTTNHKINTNGEGNLIDITTDMADSNILARDLGIGLGIGVLLTVLAVVAFILCRRYHLKKRKASKTQSQPQNIPSPANQPGNPLYDVHTIRTFARTSIMSGRYEEIGIPSDPDLLSRTLSEPKYESIPSDTLTRRNNENESCKSSNKRSLYQTVEAPSKSQLRQTESDAVYNTYFHGSGHRGISPELVQNDDNQGSRTSGSAQYFILDPNCRELETNTQTEANVGTREDITTSDNTYFVLEKQ